VIECVPTVSVEVV
jgi:hypothetical protein